MPTNNKISAYVTVGGYRVPEYYKNGEYFIESNLHTPFSYRQEVREVAYGELEVQEWPVTPYKVTVVLDSTQPKSCVYLSIDGVSIGGAVLDKNESHVFEGFKDSKGVKEFLFALPRFARDENDRVSTSRLSSAGCIKVKQYAAVYSGSWARSSHKDTSFDQVNKKDARNVTGGSYTLATTKKGKLIHTHKERHDDPSDCSQNKVVNHYHTSELLSELSFRYMMGYTLQEQGIKLSPAPWPATTN